MYGGLDEATDWSNPQPLSFSMRKNIIMYFFFPYVLAQFEVFFSLILNSHLNRDGPTPTNGVHPEMLPSGLNKGTECPPLAILAFHFQKRVIIEINMRKEKGKKTVAL